MSYTQRHIDVTFQLGQGSFGESGQDTVRISGLRVSATITKAGGVSMSSLDMKVYGLTLSQLNDLSILGKPIIDVRRNIVTVTAGDDETGMATVFTGTIYEAWPDMAAAPDVYLHITAHSALLDAARPVPPSSYPGPTDVAVIMAGLAQQMGCSFVNSGVSVILHNPYYPGTAWAQMQAAAAAAHIYAVIDDLSPSQAPNSSGDGGDNGTGQAGGRVLAIWPMDGSRGGAIPLISKDTGMVGYPTCTPNGIVVTTLYNPSITFGGNFEVQSILKVANGTWTVFNVTHELEAEVLENGAWFTHVEGTVLGHSTPVTTST